MRVGVLVMISAIHKVRSLPTAGNGSRRSTIRGESIEGMAVDCVHQRAELFTQCIGGHMHMILEFKCGGTQVVSASYCSTDCTMWTVKLLMHAHEIIQHGVNLKPIPQQVVDVLQDDVITTQHGTLYW